METVSEMFDTNCTVTYLITRKDSIADLFWVCAFVSSAKFKMAYCVWKYKIAFQTFQHFYIKGNVLEF
jgi:hypothetical protein